MAKAFRVIALNEQDILQKRFEANIIYLKDNVYSLELADLINVGDPDNIDLNNNTSLVQRQYVLNDSNNHCKYILNSDYRIDTVAADIKMVEYLNALNLTWHTTEGVDGKWCILEEVLVQLVQNPRTNYKFKLNIEVECSVNGENSEAASITKILEKLDAGNLPAFVPLVDRYHYKLHLDLPE